MKNVYTAVFATILLLSACSKGTKVCCDVSPFPDYYLFAIKADTNWLKVPRTFTIKDSLLIANESRDEGLIMLIKFVGKGTYALTEKNARYFTTTGGDVISSEYLGDTGTQNTLEITDYNESAGIIAGNYSVKLKISPRYQSAMLPQYVSFTQGKFRALLPR